MAEGLAGGDMMEIYLLGCVIAAGMTLGAVWALDPDKDALGIFGIVFTGGIFSWFVVGIYVAIFMFRDR